ncbi:24373_t:CDS:2, partial [Gigaspora rosea]
FTVPDHNARLSTVAVLGLTRKIQGSFPNGLQNCKLKKGGPLERRNMGLWLA